MEFFAPCCFTTTSPPNAARYLVAMVALCGNSYYLNEREIAIRIVEELKMIHPSIILRCVSCALNELGIIYQSRRLWRTHCTSCNCRFLSKRLKSEGAIFCRSNCHRSLETADANCCFTARI
ncbi:hypothetical protein M433DRAFT_141223 [Acidomyces richmondensis BFW]|nr:MAG: hypothetical protein FE78DRAFT_75544 [Acidomyces sp. 'richmondensis']KYG48262.1 hypothetical protein M433DRAFT_141223 [Acidomyces richmondensis BFW]